MIEPFFLGLSSHELFAAYHAAHDPGSDVLTVICPPLFSEGMRTQLALRELAIAVAQEGQHVLRFDWRGTGDSTGTVADVRVADWYEDVHAVIAEGREVTGAERVYAVGVRAAALFLCGALQANESCVERAVLWDPVPSGAEYLAQLGRIQERMLRRNRYLSRALRQLAREELAGQRLPTALRSDIEGIDSRVYAASPKCRVTAILTDGHADFGVAAFERHEVRFDCGWETDSENIMMPQPVLEGMRQCLLRP